MGLKVNARHFENGEPIQVSVEGDRITSVDPAWPVGSLADWPYVSPGFVDIQVNGRAGTWFCGRDLTQQDVVGVLESLFIHGITRVCPTLVTSSFEFLRDGFLALADARKSQSWVSQMVPGYHLEGPYISAEDGPRGAHPIEHVRAPDWDEFCRLQEAADGDICLVTLAPEIDGAIDFIQRCVESGVTVAIGHTAAAEEDIVRAADAGATLSTHLGNGAHATIRRHPNYIWSQLGDERLTPSLIVDGHHLPGSVVRSIVSAKTPRGCLLTCDAAGWAGCPPGVYDDGNVKAEVMNDGRIVLAGQSTLLAGSGVFTDTCVQQVMRDTGIGLGEAIGMASTQPAIALGVEPGGLGRGARADLVVFGYSGSPAQISVQATLMAGSLRYGELRDDR